MASLTSSLLGGAGIDVKDSFCWWRVGRVVWLWAVEYLTEMLNPSRDLVTLSGEDVALLVFDRGRLAGVLACELLCDLINCTQLAPRSCTFSFLCQILNKGPLVTPRTLLYLSILFLVGFLDLLMEPGRFGAKHLGFQLFPFSFFLSSILSQVPDVNHSLLPLFL